MFPNIITKKYEDVFSKSKSHLYIEDLLKREFDEAKTESFK